MRGRKKDIDWTMFELRFDAEGTPSIILKRTGKALPAHGIGWKRRYLAITTPDTNNILLHRAVWFLNEIRQGHELPTEYVEIHHKDGNPMNCRPENLEALTVEEHIARHNISELCREGMKRKWQDPVWREKMLDVLKRGRAKWNRIREERNERLI